MCGPRALKKQEVIRKGTPYNPTAAAPILRGTAATARITSMRSSGRWDWDDAGVGARLLCGERLSRRPSPDSSASSVPARSPPLVSRLRRGFLYFGGRRQLQSPLSIFCTEYSCPRGVRPLLGITSPGRGFLQAPSTPGPSYSARLPRRLSGGLLHRGQTRSDPLRPQPEAQAALARYGLGPKLVSTALRALSARCALAGSACQHGASLRSAPCQEVVWGRSLERRTLPSPAAILRARQAGPEPKKLKASPKGEALLTSEGRKALAC